MSLSWIMLSFPFVAPRRHHCHCHQTFSFRRLVHCSDGYEPLDWLHPWLGSFLDRPMDSFPPFRAIFDSMPKLRRSLFQERTEGRTVSKKRATSQSHKINLDVVLTLCTKSTLFQFVDGAGSGSRRTGDTISQNGGMLARFHGVQGRPCQKSVTTKERCFSKKWK